MSDAQLAGLVKRLSSGDESAPTLRSAQNAGDGSGVHVSRARQALVTLRRIYG